MQGVVMVWYWQGYWKDVVGRKKVFDKRAWWSVDRWLYAPIKHHRQSPLQCTGQVLWFLKQLVGAVITNKCLVQCHTMNHEYKFKTQKLNIKSYQDSRDMECKSFLAFTVAPDALAPTICPTMSLVCKTPSSPTSTQEPTSAGLKMSTSVMR